MTDLRRLTNWIQGLVSVVLLFVVVAHAVAPVAPEHERGRGSAFSASTAEVSLKSGTRATVAKEVVRLDPPVLPPALLALVPVLVAPAMPALPQSFAQASSRPARLAASSLGPRAPPAA